MVISGGLVVVAVVVALKQTSKSPVSYSLSPLNWVFLEKDPCTEPFCSILSLWLSADKRTFEQGCSKSKYRTYLSLVNYSVIDQMADGTLVSLLCHPCVTLASPLCHPSVTLASP